MYVYFVCFLKAQLYFFLTFLPILEAPASGVNCVCATTWLFCRLLFPPWGAGVGITCLKLVLLCSRLGNGFQENAEDARRMVSGAERGWPVYVLAQVVLISWGKGRLRLP